MNIKKSAFLLAGISCAGSVLAQEFIDCGRRVRIPGEVIVSEYAQLPKTSTSHRVGHIDADVLDFHHQSQTII